MTAECQTLVKGFHSYEEMCLCLLEVPNSIALGANCSILPGSGPAFHQTFTQCGMDFEKEVWKVLKNDVCCNDNKMAIGSKFGPQSAQTCGALTLKDPDCDPNLVNIKSRRGCDAPGSRTWCGNDRCYCTKLGHTCQGTRSCTGWDVWAPQTPRAPAPPAVPIVTSSGYTKIQHRFCNNDCVDTIAQYPPPSLDGWINAAECEQRCNADPRCQLIELAHCGRQCILLTHCSLQKTSSCSSRHPGTSLLFRPGWQPLIVKLGTPGYLVGGQGIWGKPASECGDKVYGDHAKGRCNLVLARTVGRISICESKANCIDANIASAQACADKAALISFCAKDYIEWRASDSNCYCTPVGHAYIFSTSAGGHRVYPMTAVEPR